MVQPTEGAVVRNMNFLVPHEDVPGSNSGGGKNLVFFKVSPNWLLYKLSIIIDY